MKSGVKMKKIVIGVDDFVNLKLPYEIKTYCERVFYSCLFQGIVKYDGEQIVPGLCDSYLVLNNGSKYVFKFGTKNGAMVRQFLLAIFLICFYDI